MRQRTEKIGLSVRSTGNAGSLQARRVAWLAALLVAASLTDDGLGGVARRDVPSSSRDQVFRVGRLASTRAG